MYSCAFWCEFIDLVGVFWLLLFDHYHFPQVRTPISDLTLVWDWNSYIDRIEYHFLTGWFFLMKCALHFATKPHSRDICVRGVVLGVLCIIGCPVQLIREVQSNPAISNSVNSKSPLFRRKIEFPWIYPYVFSHLLTAISNSVISNSPLFRTHRSFPTP